MTGTRESRAGTVLPSWITDDTMIEEASQQIRMTSDSHDATSLRVQADGSNARDSRGMLARAAGVDPGGEAPRGQDSGQWTLSSQLSESELRAFVRAVHSGRAEQDRARLGTAADEGLALMRAVRSATNLDDARAAVASFVNSTGTRADDIDRGISGRPSAITVDA